MVTRASLRNFRVKLAVADIDAGHMRRAARQQDIGKTAGRGADVERLLAGRIERKNIERRSELHAAARHPGIDGAGVEPRAFGDRFGGFGDRTPSRVTSPASIASRALARLAKKPRSTKARSARVVALTRS